jgi:hypothetical protein
MRTIRQILIATAAISFRIFASDVFAQDSTDTQTALPPIKVSRDTTQSEIQPAQVGIDTSVTYSARIVDTFKDRDETHLVGDATLKYKNITIKAGKITVKWNEYTLIAETLPDSSNGGNATDSLASRANGRPVFSDGKEEMTGDRMEYNFKTDRGRILRGRTQFQDGYYTGETVKRVEAKEFNVVNGRYTTCDREEPHFHFKGDKMKVIMGDKVVAKPVTFYIGKIPLAILPFAMFSTKEDGRQSGIIIPRFGTSPDEGRYLQDLGYYWAANDYFDARATLSFFEKTGVLVKGGVNYALRYHFTGSVSGSFTRKNFGATSQRRWNLEVRHSQQFNPNTSLNVNASFVNNRNFYRDLSDNRNERLNRQLVSNATFSTRWGEGKNSFSVNLSQTKDLETGRELITLPRANFTRSQTALFPFDEKKAQRTKAQQKWYNLIRYSYGNLLVNSTSRDSTNDAKTDVERRMEHDFALSFTNPGRLFGFLTISHNFTFDEDWFDRTRTFSLDSSSNTISFNEVKGFEARHLFQYSASASTKLYGTFNTRLGPVRGLRHVATPSISFAYQPDFSDSTWGYYETITDTLGRKIKRDRFEGSGARRTPLGEQNNLSFGLNNLFQMKLGQGDQERKIDLFNLDFRGGYNFAADSFKVANLSTSFRANPKKDLAVSMNLSHSFYDFDPATGRLRNRLLIKENGFFNALRLLQFNFDARWSLRGKSAAAQPPAGAAQPPGAESRGQPGTQAETGYRDPLAPEKAFTALDVPWSANIGFSYSVNKFNPLNTTRSAYLDLSNVEVQLTKNWRVSYNLRYDIQRKDVADQRISLYRDLHCWEAQFSWNPSGIGQGFYFKIGIKAPHLQDIKIEQRGGTTSIFRPF